MSGENKVNIKELEKFLGWDEVSEIRKIEGVDRE